MGPDYPPQRGMILLLLGLGVFFLIGALLSGLCWVVLGDWQSYISQIAGIAFITSIPIAYFSWSYFERHHRR
jgi:hypothetical protein